MTTIMIMKPLILVTGATGATGSFTTRELSKRGFYVHSNDERSRELESLGAEIFVGDLLDFRAFRHAFEGVQRAYFVYPLRPGSCTLWAPERSSRRLFVFSSKMPSYSLNRPLGVQFFYKRTSDP